MLIRIPTVPTLILVALAASFLSVPDAHATRAVEQVMGTAAGSSGLILNGGSLFYDQDFNIFYNPSYVNDFHDWVSIERFNGGNGTIQSTGAQGGFISSFFGYSFGAYFNRGDALLNNYAVTGPGGATNALDPVRPLDVFFGADSIHGLGVKWGLGLTVASVAAPATSTTGGGNTTDITLNGGFQYFNFEPFFAYKLQGTVSSADASDHQGAWRAGTRYRFGEWSPFFVITHVTDDSEADVTRMGYGGGIGRSSKVGDGIRLSYAVSVWLTRRTAAGSQTDHRTEVPLDINVEDDVLAWLTVRAGLSVGLVDRTNGTSTDVTPSGPLNPGTSAVRGRLGASLHLGKADLDFAVGRGAGSGENLDSSTFGFDGGFFSAAAFTYRWM